MPIEQFFQWAPQLVKALTVLRDKKIIHKDIKPHNIIVNSDQKIHSSDC